jgi:uroporphyrinogen-III synthase
LIPKESGRLISLTSLLEEIKAPITEVTEVPVYSITEPVDIARFRSLLLGGAADEFIFTSPQDVFDLARYANLSSINMRMSAADETTFQTLREFGIKPRFFQK